MGKDLTDASTQRSFVFTVPPRRIPARGADYPPRHSNAKNPCKFSGARPPYPRRPWLLCSLRSQFPPACAGGLAAFCPSFAAGDKGSVATLPASRPCTLALFGLLPPCPLRRFALGGGGCLVVSPRSVVALFVRVLSVLGVCRVSSRCLFLGSFRPFRFRAVGGLRPGRVLPLVCSFAVGVCRCGAVFVSGGCCPVRRLVGAALVARLSRLCRSPWSRWRCAVLAGFGSGGPAARSRGAWSRFPRPCRRVCGPLRAAAGLGGCLVPLPCFLPRRLRRGWAFLAVAVCRQRSAPWSLAWFQRL